MKNKDKTVKYTENNTQIRKLLFKISEWRGTRKEENKD